MIHLTPRANALGVSHSLQLSTSNNINVDNFLFGIAYVNSVSSGVWPFDAIYAYGSILIAIPNFDYTRVSQLVFRGQGVFYRIKYGDAWGKWTKC